MTCVSAARNDLGVVIGADSCTIVSDRKIPNAISESKLVEFPNFVVGMAGEGPIREALLEMLEEQDWQEHEITSAKQVYEFIEVFGELLNAGDEPDFELLFATQDKIFCVDGPTVVFEIPEYWSIGEGSSYALGSMDMTYGHLPITDVVELGIMSAIKYVPGCALPVETRGIGGMVG